MNECPRIVVVIRIVIIAPQRCCITIDASITTITTTTTMSSPIVTAIATTDNNNNDNDDDKTTTTTESYHNRSKRMETSHWIVHNGKRVRHGIRRCYTVDSTICCERPYVYGKLHGTARSYYPHGRLRQESDHINGKEDAKSCISTGWYASGAMRFKADYTDMPRCRTDVYYSNGQIANSDLTTYDNDATGDWEKTWLRDGTETQSNCEDWNSEDDAHLDDAFKTMCKCCRMTHDYNDVIRSSSNSSDRD